MSKQVQVTVEKTAPAQKKLTNAERFPTAAKAEAEAAAKKAAAKSAPAAKPVEKTAPVQAKFVNRTVKKGSPVYVLAVNSRPAHGRRLFAHTHAALALFGMFDASAPAAPKDAVLAFMGQTAVTYHLSERNFAEGPNGISLTVAGRNKFMNRLTEGKFDVKVAMAFQDLFITGKADASLGVKDGAAFPVQFGK
jgi:hypothetical protein